MRFLFYLSVFCFSTTWSLACSCDNPGKTFLTSLSDFTAELEVVDTDTMQSVSNHLYRPIVVYKLKVNKRFKGSKQVEYVWMENIISTDCQRGLFPDSLGQRYIVTGILFETRDYKPWLQAEEQRSFLHVSSCGKTILKIDQDTVIGFVNENKEEELRVACAKQSGNDIEKARACFKEIYEKNDRQDFFQHMPITTFYELMKD